VGKSSFVVLVFFYQAHILKNHEHESTTEKIISFSCQTSIYTINLSFHLVFLQNL